MFVYRILQHIPETFPICFLTFRFTKYAGCLRQKLIHEHVQRICSTRKRTAYRHIGKPIRISMGTPVHRTSLPFEQPYAFIECYMNVLSSRITQTFISTFEPRTISCVQIVLPSSECPHHTDIGHEPPLPVSCKASRGLRRVCLSRVFRDTSGIIHA